MRNIFQITLALLAWAMATPLSAQDMTFRIDYRNHTNVIVAEGTITGETPSNFQAFLDTKPFDGFRILVALNSDGGNLFGGLILGQMIRENRFETDVRKIIMEPGETFSSSDRPGGCYSACALAYLGGERRGLHEGSEIGFHQFSSAQGSSDREDSVFLTEASAQLIGATVLGYIMQMGAEPNIFARASEALPSEMWIPDAQERRALRIVTPTRFRSFDLEPAGRGIVAYARLPENVEGRSVAGQVTAYCKSGTSYLLISALEHDTLQAETRLKVAENQDGFTISSGGIEYTLSRHSVSIREGNGLPIAEIRLSPEAAHAFTVGPTHARLDIPAVWGAIIGFQTDPTAMDSKALKAAFSLCIS
jgi:hypothetical protein